ncbi:sigma-70 family RNA polymerase sigma factor [Microbacterium sp. 22215]|uniref:sigma-70 family RNA polymerase sigma factor n=1 Tax=Microbacterium sp. 22215 TaxID=3453893 RepID=UPI003F83CF38
MSAATPVDARTRIDPDTSDDDLVRATRAGDSRAYGVLWDRHSPAALRAARSITSSIDPDDLVSEAFAKTFSAIRNGGGPTEAFRPYLFAAVRSAAATWGGKQKDLALDYIDELPVDDAEDSLDLLSDRALLTAAFKDLPERWRTLLWYLEVEGMKPREIAPLMGMTPNAVSVLATRAREGFKVAWLHAHIKEPGRDAECRWTCERIVAQGRKRHVARADRARFESHLESCRRCTMASAEVAQASSKLRAVLLPAIIGGPAAAAYSAASPAPASAAVVAGALPRGAMPWLVVGGTVVVVTVAAAIVAVAAQLAPTETPAADGAPALVIESPAPISTPVSQEAPVVPTVPVIPPAPPATEPDAQTLPDSPAEPAPDSVVEPAPSPQIDEETTPLEPRSRPQVRPPAAPPVVEPIHEVPVTISWIIPPGSTDIPPITGSGTPGAQIAIIDEGGLVVATAIVDEAGTFSVVPDADALHQDMSVSVRHTAPDTGEVTVSDPIGPIGFDTPVLADHSNGFLARTDVDGDGEHDDLALVVQGIVGATVSLSFDGGPASTVLLSDASTVATLLDVPPGFRKVTVRYVDPVTGALGVAEVDRILVSP